MDGVTGGSLPARLWGRIVGRALEGVPPRPLPAATPAVADVERLPDGEEEDVGLIARILRNLTGASEDEASPRNNSARPVDQGGPQR